MYNTALDTMKQMGDVVKSLYDKVSSSLRAVDMADTVKGDITGLRSAMSSTNQSIYHHALYIPLQAAWLGICLPFRRVS